MPSSRRLAWLVFIAGVGLLLVILFHAFIWANLIVPVATLLWLLWRVVESVHQAMYWGLVIAAVVGLLVVRLFQVLSAAESSAPPPPESMLKSINYWRTWIVTSGAGDVASDTLRRELTQMLASAYATKQTAASLYRLHEALRLRQVPLPPRLYAFLYPDEAAAARPTWSQQLRRWAERPGQWIRRWTGREQAEYYQTIEETLAFMESLMEIKHGDDSVDPSHH